jgi:hypothetical protein
LEALEVHGGGVQRRVECMLENMRGTCGAVVTEVVRGCHRWSAAVKGAKVSARSRLLEFCGSKIATEHTLFHQPINSTGSDIIVCTVNCVYLVAAHSRKYM